MSNYEEVSGGSISFWSPKEPTTVEGVLVERREGVGNFNSIGYVLSVPGEDEQIMVTANGLLDDMLKKVPIGYMVRIDFLGYKLSKAGNQFKNYRVFKKPAEMEPVQPQAVQPQAVQQAPPAQSPQPVMQPVQNQSVVPPPIQQQKTSLVNVSGNIYKNQSGILVDQNGNFVNHLGIPSPVPIRYVDVASLIPGSSNPGDPAITDEVPF